MPQIQGGVIGGGGLRYQGVQAAAPQDDGTANVLLKMGNSFLSAKLEQEQQRLFVKGMQQVAVGDAYKDIKSGDNSVLSSIFGPSATVQGAAAMAKVTQLEDFTSQAYSDMEGNASMSPGQFRDRIVGGMQSHLTGEPEVDNVLQAKMVESMPGLMKAQAKANYAYIQKQSEIGFGRMMTSAANTLDQTIKSGINQGTLTDEDKHAAGIAFLKSVQPVGGMNEDTYRKALVNSTLQQFAEGNLWHDQILRKSGMYDSLAPEDLAKIDTARDHAEAKVRQEYGFNKYGPQIGAIVGGAEGRSPAETMQMMNALQKRFMDETGSDQGLFDVKDATEVNSKFWSRKYRMDDTLREKKYESDLTAQRDAASEGRLAVEVQRSLELGQGNYLKGMAPEYKVDSAFTEQFSSKMAKDPNQAFAFATQNYTHGNAYINPQLKGMLTESFRQLEQGGVPGPELDRTMQMLDQWQAVPESGSAISAYIGPENEARLQRYRNSMVAFKGDKSAAAKAAFGTPMVKGPSTDPADVQVALQQQIVKKAAGSSSWAAGIGRWLSGYKDMDDASQKTVLAAIKPDIDSYVSNMGMSLEQATSKAMEGAGQLKVDIVGRYAYQKQPNQLPLGALAHLADEDMTTILPQFLQTQAQNQGIAVNLAGGGRDRGRATPWTNTEDLTNAFGMGTASVSIVRDRDGVGPDGKPYGVFIANLGHGDKTAIVRFTSNDLGKFASDTLRKNVQQTRQDRKDLFDPAKPVIIP